MTERIDFSGLLDDASPVWESAHSDVPLWQTISLVLVRPLPLWNEDWAGAIGMVEQIIAFRNNRGCDSLNELDGFLHSSPSFRVFSSFPYRLTKKEIRLLGTLGSVRFLIFDNNSRFPLASTSLLLAMRGELLIGRKVAKKSLARHRANKSGKESDDDFFLLGIFSPLLLPFLLLERLFSLVFLLFPLACSCFFDSSFLTYASLIFFQNFFAHLRYLVSPMRRPPAQIFRKFTDLAEFSDFAFLPPLFFLLFFPILIAHPFISLFLLVTLTTVPHSAERADRLEKEKIVLLLRGLDVCGFPPTVSYTLPGPMDIASLEEQARLLAPLHGRSRLLPGAWLSHFS